MQRQGFVAMATRSGLAPFVKLASRILAHQLGINVALVHGLSNACTESANNNRRILTRLAFWTATATDGAATLLLEIDPTHGSSTKFSREDAHTRLHCLLSDILCANRYLFGI